MTQSVSVCWLFGFTLLFGFASSYSKPATDSVVKCKLDALSKSSFESVRVGAHAASKADAALCNDDTDAIAVAESTALSISRVFADAFMGAIVDCYAEGYAHYTINGKSLATAQAYAFAEAFAEASVVSKTCHHCLAASELLAHSYAEIFISAAHEAEVSIKGVAKGGRDEDDYTIISQHLVEKTMVAFAQVIVKAKAKVDECRATAEVRVATGDRDDLNKVECKVDTAAASDYKVKDACEHAAEDLALYVCDMEDRTTGVLQVQAEAIAEAVAMAIAGISAGCKIEGQGIACAVGFSEISQAATAVAEAYAGAFMGATAECKDLCHTDEDDMVTAIGSVLVTATANVYQYHCTGPDSYFSIEDMETQIVAATVTALSQLLAQATVVTSDGRMTACMMDMDMTSAIAPVVAVDQLATTRLAGTAVAAPPFAPAQAPEQSTLDEAAFAPQPSGDLDAENASRDVVSAPGPVELEAAAAMAPGPDTLQNAVQARGEAAAPAPGPGTQVELLVQPPAAAPEPMGMQEPGVETSALLVEAPAPVLLASTSERDAADAGGPGNRGAEETDTGSSDEAARTALEEAAEDESEQKPKPNNTSEPDVVITSTVTSTDDTADTEPTNTPPSRNGKVAAQHGSRNPQPRPVGRRAPKPGPRHKRPPPASKPGPRKGRPSKRPPVRRRPVMRRRRPSRAPVRRPRRKIPAPKRKPSPRTSKQPKGRPVPRRSKVPSKAAHGRRPAVRPMPRRRPAARQVRRRPAAPKRQPRKRVPRNGTKRVMQQRRRPTPTQPQKKGAAGKQRAARMRRAPRRPRK